jgi:hypothetical protein
VVELTRELRAQSSRMRLMSNLGGLQSDTKVMTAERCYLAINLCTCEAAKIPESIGILIR